MMTIVPVGLRESLICRFSLKYNRLNSLARSTQAVENKDLGSIANSNGINILI
jgi:hypothetical protein